MRNVLGSLLALAAALGMHCSAPAEPLETSTSERGSPAEAVAPPARQAPSAEPETTHAPEVPVLDLSALIHDGSSPHVTSTVSDASGATYATGTFVGSVVIGHTVIRSRGDKDVFLVKLSPLGSFEWVRAVGSAALESSPRVTLEDGHRVTVIGMTKGEMDCGSGPLNTWDSSTFFVCIFVGSDGASVTGGVFPTGNL